MMAICWSRRSSVRATSPGSVSLAGERSQGGVRTKRQANLPDLGARRAVVGRDEEDGELEVAGHVEQRPVLHRDRAAEPEAERGEDTVVGIVLERHHPEAGVDA